MPTMRQLRRITSLSSNQSRRREGEDGQTLARARKWPLENPFSAQRHFALAAGARIHGGACVTNLRAIQ